MEKEQLKVKLFDDFVWHLRTDRMYNYKWFMHYRRHHYKELSVVEIREVYSRVAKFLGI